MTKSSHPSFAIVPALAFAGLFSVLITLPFDFPFFSLYHSDYLPRLVESATFGLASASALHYFQILRTWTRFLAVVGTFVVAHVLEQVVDPYLPSQATRCWDCTPTSFFTTDVALRFLLVSGVIFIVCIGVIAPRPKLASLLLASIGSACLGSVAMGFLDSRSQWAHMSLVVNGRPLGVLWQPTLAFFLGLAVWVGGRLAVHCSPSLQASARLEAQTTLPNRYAGLCVFAAFVLLMGACGTVIGHLQNNTTNEKYMQRDAQIARSIHEAPPVASLSVSDSVRPEDVMVTENLGDWKIYYSQRHHSDAISGIGQGVFPEREAYDAFFAHSESAYYIRVEITQYPNKDWARYELRNIPRANALYEDHGEVHQLTRFAGKVYQDGPEFYWASEDKTILLDCQVIPPHEIDLFVKAYLQKYPSSVQVADGPGPDSDRQ
jgi:hypothetical protein